MQVRDLVFLLCAVAFAGVFVYKFRHLWSRWSSPMLWALCSIPLLGATDMWVLAPSNQSWLNEVTGVSNIGALFSNVLASAMAASFLTVALLWRYPAPEAWPRICRVLIAYGAAIAAASTLFAISSVPEERLTDFGTNYATQFTVAAFLTICLAADVGGTAVLAILCLDWARRRDYAQVPWLRRGLRLYGLGSLVTALALFGEWVILASNWFGLHAWNSFTGVPTMFAALVAGPLVTGGLVVPIWGPRWPAVRRWMHLWRVLPVLRSLHRALRPVAPDIVFVSPGRRWNPHHRVRRMVIELSDWRWMLAPLFDPAVAAQAEERGRRAGLTGDALAAAVEAAALDAAVRAWERGDRPDAGPTGERPTHQEEDIRDGTDLETELAWWLEVARAFGRVRQDRTDDSYAEPTRATAP